MSDEWKKYILANREKYTKLTAAQDRALGRLYIDFAGNAKREALAIIDKKTWSYTQKRYAVRELLKEASKLTDDFKGVLDKALIESANVGADVNRVMLKKYSQRLGEAGFDVNMQRVLYSVPNEAVKLTYNRILEDGLKLSDRIWILDKRTKQEIERIVLEEIASGRPASDRILEARLNKLLNPSRRAITTKLHGRNVQFDAARLLRTERATAFREADRLASMNNPGLVGIAWHTTGDACAECEDIASGGDEGLGAGVYKPENLPAQPHPQCMCYTSDVAISSKQFTTNWIEFIDSKSTHPELDLWYKDVYLKAA